MILPVDIELYGYRQQKYYYILLVRDYLEKKGIYKWHDNSNHYIKEFNYGKRFSKFGFYTLYNCKVPSIDMIWSNNPAYGVTDIPNVGERFAIVEGYSAYIFMATDINLNHVSANFLGNFKIEVDALKAKEFKRKAYLI